MQQVDAPVVTWNNSFPARALSENGKYLTLSTLAGTEDSSSLSSDTEANYIRQKQK